MSRRKIYKHLVFNNMLVNTSDWTLTEAEYNLMNKARRKAYKNYRNVRKLPIFEL